MIVIINTPIMQGEMIGRPWNEITSVVTLDTRSVLLISRASTRALYDGPGKVHWGTRRENHAHTGVGSVTAFCSAAIGIGYYPYTGKATEITCSKCKEKWWANERLLNGPEFIRNG